MDLISLAYAKKLANLAEGPQGPPGEVTTQQLNTAIDNAVTPIEKDVTQLKSDITNIEPTWINPNKVYYPSEDIDGVTSASGYYTQANSGYAPAFRSSLQHLIVPVERNDVLQCYTGNNDITSNNVAFSFFCTVDDDDICHSFVTWEKIDDANKIYQLVIPKNVTKLYLTYLNNATPWVKKCSNEFSYEWLKVEDKNFERRIAEKLGYKYGDSLKKPFVFSGKNAVFFGDSIAYGTCSPNLGFTESFLQRFLTSVGANIIRNQAVGGSCIADPDTATSILNKVLNYDRTTDDYYIIAGGTNDFNTSKELGVYGSTDTSNFYGALKAICEYLTTLVPTKTVIFITPIPYTDAYFDIHPTFVDGNSLGYTLNDYRNAIYEVATSYGFNVVDGSNIGMPTGKGGWSNAMCDDTDGCHPTIAGHELYARNLQGKLL